MIERMIVAIADSAGADVWDNWVILALTLMHRPGCNSLSDVTGTSYEELHFLYLERRKFDFT